MQRPLIERVVGTTDAATAVLIELPIVKPGLLERIQSYSLYNQSGEQVTVIPGIVTLAGFVACDYTYTVADGAAFQYAQNFLWVREGERFAMQVKGTANKSTVTMVVSGAVYSLDAVDVVLLEPKPAGQ